MIINQKIHFIHANGFPPEAYKSLFDLLKNEFNKKKFLLQPSNYKTSTIKQLKNWKTFHDEFINSLNVNEKVIGVGHSIGGNIILRSALKKPKCFSKIIVLDPTLFIPSIIYMWKFSSFLGIQNKLHPWLKISLNRKMVYDNFDDIMNKTMDNCFKRVKRNEKVKLFSKYYRSCLPTLIILPGVLDGPPNVTE